MYRWRLQSRQRLGDVGDQQQGRLAEPLREIATVALAAQPATDRWPECSALPCATPSGAAKHIRFYTDILALAGLADLKDRVVLDVGSGFGLALGVYVLLGAARAYGIEYVPEAVEAAGRYLANLPAGIAERVENRHGDAAAIPHPDAAFDVVFSVEAISHYADVPAFFAKAARVLKPGGLLLISDGNNGNNPLVARETRRIWRAFEEGEPGTRVGTHTVRRSYRDMRAEVIARASPHLRPDEVASLAANSAGSTSDEVLDAARAYVATGRLAERRYRDGDLAVSPEGVVMERLFSPPRRARDIERYAFRARAYGYWGGAGGRRHVRIANRVLTPLSPLTMPLARGFRIVAVRT